MARPKAQARTQQQKSRAPLWAVAAAVVAVLAVLGALGVRSLLTFGTRESAFQDRARERARVAAEAAQPAKERFLSYPADAKIEADAKRIGFVFHEHAGGFLLQAQQAIPANSSVLRVPYTAVIDAQQAGVLLPGLDEVLRSHEADLLKAVSAGRAPAPGSDAAAAELARLRVLAVLVALRRGDHNTPWTEALRRMRVWAKAAVPADFANDLSLLPEVAGRCLDRSEKRQWEQATASAARDLAALRIIVADMPPAVFNVSGGSTVTLADVAWSISVLRTRGWQRPPPYYHAVVPGVDLNDQRASEGWRAALRTDRAVTASLHFDDNATKVHLVTLEPLSRGAYPVLRGDAIAAPLPPMTTQRLYGFADEAGRGSQGGWWAVLAHAEALFSDREDLVKDGCTRSRVLFYNVTSGEPSPVLLDCTRRLIGKDAAAARRFLGIHARRVATELYPAEAMQRCRSLAHKRAGSAEAEQAATLVALHDVTREGLLAVHQALGAP